MAEIGKFPPRSRPLTLHQSVGVILEIRPPQHDLSCFASHARADRAAWQGDTSFPVASPGAGVFPTPCTLDQGPHRPVDPMRRRCLCDTTKGPSCPCGTLRSGEWSCAAKALRPWNRPKGLAPRHPCAAGGQKAAQQAFRLNLTRGAFAPPGPTTGSVPPGPGPAVCWTDHGLVPPLDRAGYCGASNVKGDEP
jgi:hypothetical protein